MRYKKNNHCICGMCSFHKSGYGCTLDKHHRAENKQLKKEITRLKTQLLPNEYEQDTIDAMDEGKALKGEK